MTTRTDSATGGKDAVTGISFARVLVALTGAEGAGALIETACLAARATQAAVTGIYVREQALADLAALPFATVLAPGRGAAEAVTPEAVERAWLRGEAACRSAFHTLLPAQAAAFETVAGRIETVIASRAAPGDLVVLGAGAGLRPRPSEALVKAAAMLAGAVLLVPADGICTRGPVVAVDDGDAAGAGTVRLAARIARTGKRRLSLLALAKPGAHRALAARAASLAGGAFALHSWPVERAGDVWEAVSRLDPSLVVADLAGLPFAGEGALDATLRRMRTPLLLLSGPAARRMAQRSGQ